MSWIDSILDNQGKVYSQRGQDGIIEYIFQNIGTSSRYCVEFGFNSLELCGGTGPNTARLIHDCGWDGLLLDKFRENHSINLHKYDLSADNIVEIFNRHGVPADVDFVSIDVDSIDLWLFRALLLGGIRPRLFSVEYNSNFHFDMSITALDTMVNNGDAVYGASMSALNCVANEFGYSLIAVLPSYDLFFVRDDLIDEASYVGKFARYCGRPCHVANGTPNADRLQYLVEYPSMDPMPSEYLERLGW